MNTIRRTLLATLATPALARGQGLDDRPVRFIVPFPPGGGTDMFARMLAQEIARPLGRAVVVENRAGAGGNIGAEAVARAAPDGHSVLFTTAAIAINESLYRRLPFDPTRDLAPLVLVAAQPHILVATRPSGITTLDDMLRRARAAPGALGYASPGNGTSSHLTMELLRSRAGVEITHIPYRGAGPAANAMLANDAPLGISVGAVLRPHIEAGRLVAVATTGAARLAMLPATPTLAEAGMPGIVTEQWHGTFVPAATPAALRAQLASAMAEAASGSAFAARVNEDGARVVNAPPAEFSAFIAAERAKWAEMVRISGATVD